MYLSTSDPRIRTFFFGGVAHASETIIVGHLLDRIKVQREIKPHISSNTEALCDIFRIGVKNFYRGFGLNLALSSLKGSFGWTINRISYDIVNHMSPSGAQKNNPLAFSAAIGVTTGCLEAVLFICPLNRLKTVKMSSEAQDKLWHLKTGGIRYLYKGLPETALKLSVNWMFCLGIYTKINAALLEQDYISSRSIKRFVLGTATGGLAALITAPMDLVISNIQKAGQPQGTKEVFLLIYREHGVQGFYNGFTPKVLRAAATSAIVVYLLDFFNALPPNMEISS